MKGKRLFWIVLFLAGFGVASLVGWRLFSHLHQPLPNVVVITMDTTRADHLSCYGYQEMNTPRIDAIAQEGVLFEESYSVQPVTLPSHCSIFTGKYPFHHGVRDNNMYRLSDQNRTLAEMLTEQGYVTAAFVSSFILDRRFGLNQGFQLYNDRFLKPKQKGRLPVDRRAVEVSILASKWLETNRATLKTSPFFLWLHYYDPHADYDPPAPYKQAYPGSPYDGEIAYMDDWIGYVCDDLKRFKLWDNTILVVVGDHGESFGEYGEQTHGIFIYRPTTRVPLIIRSPRALPQGVRIKERISTVDIMPTLLDMLHCKAPEALDGRSLLPLIQGKTKGYPRIIYSEAFIPKSFNWSELKGIRRGDEFFIEAPKPELYRVRLGEQERENVIGSYPAEAEAMQSTLLALLADEDTTNAEQVAVTQDMIERLKSLGYFVGGGEDAKGEERRAQGSDPKEQIKLFTLYQRANSAAGNEQYDSAVSLFEKILEQDPDNPRFLIEAGDIAIKQKDFETAEKHLKHALAIDTKDPRPHYLLGLCYQTWEKPTLALKVYNDAIARNADHFLAHFQIGLLNIGAEKWDEAKEAFLQTKRIRPRDVSALNNLGYIAIKGEGDFKTGIDLIHQALAIAPQNPDIMASLGSAYFNVGDYQNAATHLEAALALVPDNLAFLAQLKAVYEMLGDREKGEQLKERERILESAVNQAP